MLAGLCEAGMVYDCPAGCEIFEEGAAHESLQVSVMKDKSFLKKSFYRPLPLVIIDTAMIAMLFITENFTLPFGVFYMLYLLGIACGMRRERGKFMVN